MIRSLILKFGELVLNIVVVLSLLGVLVAGIGSMTQSFFMGLGILIGGTMYVVLVFYIIFLFIDMKSSLRELVDLQKQNNTKE